MKPLQYLSNSIWKIISKSKFDKFIIASNQVSLTQEKYLLDLLKRNQNTSYGKRYNFKAFRNSKDYQTKVPITEYEDYRHYLEQIRDGKKNILSSDPFLRFTLTSGTTSSSKWIPYNVSLKKEFEESIGTWVYNLFEVYPELLNGSAYWSISPILNEEKYDSKIPVGFEEDSSYFGFLERFLVNSIQAVPALVSKISNFDDFKYVTLLFLISDSELRLISVWSPSYLKILLDYYKEKSDSLLNDLENGTISINIEQKFKKKLLSKLRRDPKRVEYLKKISKEKHISWEQVWRHLTLISLWTDGNSKLFLPEIQKLFPNTKIQGKGLLSTEGFITFPFHLNDFFGNVLAVNSHFFEFREIESGKVYLTNELKMDSIYEIILTTGGGLYRYATKDRVQLTGYYNQVPNLSFLGKEETISDLVGEKLSEQHLQQVLKSEFKKFKINPEFYYVKPVINENVGTYILFLETLNNYNKKNLANSIDSLLMDNIYYAHAREAGQLSKFQIESLPNDSMKEYLESKSKRNLIGTTKHSLFHHKTDTKKDNKML